jgi:hypothetical protein
VAFLPRSQVDVRPVRDVGPLMQSPQPVPHPEDGQAPRQHRRVAPLRAGRTRSPSSARSWSAASGRPDPRRRGQEHHRIRRLRRPRRHRRPPACHRHGVEARQPPVRDPQHRRDRAGADHPDQPGNLPHLARHEAAGIRSLGRHRGQIPDRRTASAAGSPTSPITAPSWSWSRGSRG